MTFIEIEVFFMSALPANCITAYLCVSIRVCIAFIIEQSLNSSPFGVHGYKLPGVRFYNELAKVKVYSYVF